MQVIPFDFIRAIFSFFGCANRNSNISLETFLANSVATCLATASSCHWLYWNFLIASESSLTEIQFLCGFTWYPATSQNFRDALSSLPVPADAFVGSLLPSPVLGCDALEDSLFSVGSVGADASLLGSAGLPAFAFFVVFLFLSTVLITCFVNFSPKTFVFFCFAKLRWCFSNMRCSCKWYSDLAMGDSRIVIAWFTATWARFASLCSFLSGWMTRQVALYAALNA